MSQAIINFCNILKNTRVVFSCITKVHPRYEYELHFITLADILAVVKENFAMSSKIEV